MMETKDFDIIFTEVKKKLNKYAGKMTVTKDHEKAYELTIDKPITLAGRTYPTLFFAAGMMHKGHVGFYFFPIYTHPQSFANIPPELKKTLKGKSCFNIKKWDDTLAGQVEDLLKEGFEFYKKQGLV
jgi:hypothetical protein